MWALKKIVNEEFPHLLDLLSNIYEPNSFIHIVNYLESCEWPNDKLNDEHSKRLKLRSSKRQDDNLSKRYCTMCSSK